VEYNIGTDNLSRNYIIEEPELNLYPTNQKALINFLVKNCMTDNNHLLLTTHSPYILSSLDNLIQAGNVIKKHPELKEDVEKIIPAKYHLNYEDVKVYFVADGTARLIMDEELQSIDVSELDVVSESLDSEFEKLLDLKYQD
ncbi:MAG: AAA family ATPase, partial [Saprospiraceae bacterium]|nr:AAA family ATPase [Saprospiraceae bacterium]